MADITTKLNDVTVPPLDIVGRTAIYVFYSSYKYVRQLSRFGDLGYSSKKARYAILYVDTEQLETVIPQIETLHFVKTLKVSELDHLDLDFSRAFHETVSEAKKAVEQ